MKLISQLLFVFILCGCYSKKPTPIKTGKEGRLMPVIDLVLIDSNLHFNTNSIPKGKPSILFSFEPWCPYCKAQTRSILSNIESLKDINVYILINSPYKDFKVFYDRFHLEKYPSIKAGIDYNGIFSQYFETSQIPYIAIYNKERKLKQVVIGKQYVSFLKDIALE